LPNKATDKSARQALSQIYRQTIFGYFHHNREIVMHTKKTGSGLQLIANHPVFQFETEFFSVSFNWGMVFQKPKPLLDYLFLT